MGQYLMLITLFDQFSCLSPVIIPPGTLQHRSLTGHQEFLVGASGEVRADEVR